MNLFTYILTIILTIVFTTTVLLTIGVLLEKRTCELKSNKMSMEYSFSVLEGCFVKYKGSWISYNKLRLDIND